MRTTILSTRIDVDEEMISEYMEMNEVNHNEAEMRLYESEREYVTEEIKTMCDNFDYPILLSGTVGTWRGRFSAWKLCHNANELLNAIFDNYDDIEIIKEGKHFVINLMHHDGTNSMTLMELSSRGKLVDDPNPERSYQWKYIHDIKLWC